MEEACFMGCPWWHKLPLLKYLKGYLSKGMTFINSANDWIRVGTGRFFPLSSPPTDLFIQLMRNAAELTSSSKSHLSQDGISLHCETSLLFSVKPSDTLKGGAECQKINRKKHTSGRHAWPPKPLILDRLNIYFGFWLACHDVGKWPSLCTGNMLLCVILVN